MGGVLLSSAETEIRPLSYAMSKSDLRLFCTPVETEQHLIMQNVKKRLPTITVAKRTVRQYNLSEQEKDPSPAMSTGIEIVLLRVDAAPSFPCSPAVINKYSLKHLSVTSKQN